MIRRTLALIHKEFLHILRDRRSLMVMIAIPIIQLMLMGYASSNSVEHLRTVVFDGDRSQASRELIEAYTASNYFNIIAYANNLDEIFTMIDSGQARAGLAIPTGYAQDLDKGRRPDVAFYIDGSDPSIANTAFASSQSIGQAKAISIIQHRLPGMTGSSSSIEVRPRVLYNPNMDGSYFMIPGLLGMILFNLTIMSTAMAIVREREQGTIEQLIVTPVQSIELITGKLVPYIVVGYVNMAEILLLSVFWFKVPVQGNIYLLLLLAVLFMVPSLGIGVFISTISSTQKEAMMSTMMIMFPSVFLGGLLFPIEAMPGWLQAVTYLVPLRYILVISRGIFLKGIGFPLLLNEIIALILFSVLIMGVAASRFKKRLE
jgi:ABC-2 type transport system permease protein